MLCHETMTIGTRIGPMLRDPTNGASAIHVSPTDSAPRVRRRTRRLCRRAVTGVRRRSGPIGSSHGGRRSPRAGAVAPPSLRLSRLASRLAAAALALRVSSLARAPALLASRPLLLLSRANARDRRAVAAGRGPSSRRLMRRDRGQVSRGWHASQQNTLRAAIANCRIGPRQRGQRAFLKMFTFDP